METHFRDKYLLAMYCMTYQIGKQGFQIPVCIIYLVFPEDNEILYEKSLLEQ